MSENELLDDISGWQRSYSTLRIERDQLRARIAELEAEVERLRKEMQVMIDQAGEAVGTDPSLRSSACVTVLADHVRTLRDELARVRDAAAPEPYDAEWVTEACPWCLKLRGSPGMVCKDKFGLRCVVEGCGWGSDLTAPADGAWQRRRENRRKL